MSKTLTLADLNEALKPIHQAIKQMVLERTSSDVQVHEIHNISVAISSKMDVLEQQVGSLASSLTVQPVTRKLVGRKGAAKKPVVKKAAKGKGKGKKNEDDESKDLSENGDGDDAADDAADDADDVDDAVDDAVDENADTDESKDLSENAASDSKSKKSTVKKTVVKKVAKEPVKKSTKKESKPKKVAKMNKMQYFKNAYDTDEKQFAKYLTVKVKKTIDTDNKDVWADLEDDKLLGKRINAYYEFMRDNHGTDLELMRDKYMVETATTEDDDGEEE